MHPVIRIMTRDLFAFHSKQAKHIFWGISLIIVKEANNP